MPLTITVEHNWREGLIAHAIVKVTFDNSYAAGGESLDLSAQMKSIWYIDGKVTEDDDGYVLGFDDTDFATAIALCLLFQGDYDQGADAPLVEVTGDMSAKSARIHAFGSAR